MEAWTCIGVSLPNEGSLRLKLAGEENNVQVKRTMFSRADLELFPAAHIRYPAGCRMGERAVWVDHRWAG